MDNLEKKVFETIQKYNLIQRGDRIVVAVSGGPDSICLLDILNKIKNSHKIGDEMKIKVNRNGQEKDLTITLGEQP